MLFVQELLHLPDKLLFRLPEDHFVELTFQGFNHEILQLQLLHINGLSQAELLVLLKGDFFTRKNRLLQILDLLNLLVLEGFEMDEVLVNLLSD